MTTSGRSVQPGAPLARILARDWNAMLQLVDKDRQGGVTRVNSIGDGPWADNQIIQIKNITTAPVPQFGVLKLLAPVIWPNDNESEFRRAIVATGGLPQDSDTAICVALEPIAPQAIGRAVVGGLVPVKMRAQSDATKPYARGAASTNWLGYSSGGLPVVWNGPRDTETNTRWAWVFLGPAATTVNTTEPRDGAVLINNCDVNDCLSEGSPWADLVDSEICTKVPHQYEIGGGLNLLAPTTQCCAGKIWNEIPAPNSGAIIAGPKILTRATGLNWYSDWFECADLLRTGSNSCGSAVWEWQANCGSVTYTWLPGSGTCAIANTTIYWTPGFPTCSTGTWSGGFCGDGCVPENTGPPEDPCATQSRTVPCVPDYTWVADGSCNCGTAPAPTEPGAFYGQTVTVTCETNGQNGIWVMIQDCDCGTATPPSSPGSYDGQRATTGCGSVLGNGYDGYSQTLTVRWRLQVFSLTDARLQLVDQSGKVYYDYRLPSPRQWCCLCANSLVYASCGPHWDCPPYAALCVRPHRPEVCRAANGCDATMIEVNVSGFANQTGLFCNSYPDGADSRGHADAFNGAFVLETSGSGQDCIATYRRDWEGPVPVGYDDAVLLTLEIKFANVGSRLTFPQPLPSPPAYWYGPVVWMRLIGRLGPINGSPSFEAIIVYRRGGESFNVLPAVDAPAPVTCGTDAEFTLLSETWGWMNLGADPPQPDEPGCNSSHYWRIGDITIAPATITVRARE